MGCLQRQEDVVGRRGAAQVVHERGEEAFALAAGGVGRLGTVVRERRVGVRVGDVGVGPERDVWPQPALQDQQDGWALPAAGHARLAHVATVADGIDRIYGGAAS